MELYLNIQLLMYNVHSYMYIVYVCIRHYFVVFWSGRYLSETQLCYVNVINLII